VDGPLARPARRPTKEGVRGCGAFDPLPVSQAACSAGRRRPAKGQQLGRRNWLLLSLAVAARQDQLRCPAVACRGAGRQVVSNRYTFDIANECWRVWPTEWRCCCCSCRSVGIQIIFSRSFSLWTGARPAGAAVRICANAMYFNQARSLTEQDSICAPAQFAICCRGARLD
jgi:hypothetical protein